MCDDAQTISFSRRIKSSFLRPLVLDLFSLSGLCSSEDETDRGFAREEEAFPEPSSVS